MTEKGRIQRSKFAKGNKDKERTEENGRHITILYILIMVITCQRFRTEIYNIKQEEPEGKPTNPTKIQNSTQGKGSSGNNELSESKR